MSGGLFSTEVDWVAENAVSINSAFETVFEPGAPGRHHSRLASGCVRSLSRQIEMWLRLEHYIVCEIIGCFESYLIESLLSNSSFLVSYDDSEGEIENGEAGH